MTHRVSIITFTTILSFLILIQFGCRSSETISDEAPLLESPATSDVTDHSPPADFPQYPLREFRAAWVATVANIDWPSEQGLSVEQQKDELLKLLNKAISLNLNAIIFQVRPAADAIYDSPYEPWSSFLTGTMGQAPLPTWDPLEFIIHESHKRGLELHAWFNPYRAGHPSNRSKYSPDHISKTNPEYVHQYGDFLWLDPGIPEVKEHTINVILDVVHRYDIDGVHFDDYFYPYPSYADNAEFPDSLAWQKAIDSGVELSRDDWRRENVNSLVRDLYHRVKEIKPHVKFGISPFGIWRSGQPSFTNGFDAYSDLYADARLWLNEGWLDYITPQIYYQMGQVAQPFPVMLNWWREQNLQNRHLWPGLYTSRLWTPDRTWSLDELLGQIYTARAFPGVSGAVHFSIKTFLQNSSEINHALTAGPYAQQALIPASDWMDSGKPEQPELAVYDYGDFWKATFYSNQLENLSLWVLRSKYDHGWETRIYPGQLGEVSFYGGQHIKRPLSMYLSAVNRTGIESDPAAVYLQESVEPTSVSDSVKIVKRSEWSRHKPGGVDANAIRRNISYNDTLRFHDLTLITGRMMRSMAFPGRLLKVDPGDPDEEDQYRESISIELFKNEVSESVSMQPGEIRNWNGFQISLLNLNFDKNLAEFEVSLSSSQTSGKPSKTETEDSDQRFRISHDPTRIAISSGPNMIEQERYPNTADYLNDHYEIVTKSENWWDLPAHYYIDNHGIIYEGRDRKYSGESFSRYDPRGTIVIQLLSIPSESGNENLSEEQKDSLVYLISKLVVTDDLEIHELYPFSDLDAGVETEHQLTTFIRDGTLLQLVIRQLGNNHH